MDIESFTYFDPFLDVHNFNKFFMASSEILDDEQKWDISNDDLVSTHDSSGGTWEGPSTYEPDERGHHPYFFSLVNDSEPIQYGRNEIPTLVPEQTLWVGAASLPMAEPAAGLKPNIRGTQPYFKGRSENKQGSKGIHMSSSKTKISRRKEALITLTDQGAPSLRVKNYGARVRERRKEERVQIYDRYYSKVSPDRITLNGELHCPVEEDLPLKVMEGGNCDFAAPSAWKEREEHGLSAQSKLGADAIDPHQSLQEEYGNGQGCLGYLLGEGCSAREMLSRLQDALLKHAREELAKSVTAT